MNLRRTLMLVAALFAAFGLCANPRPQAMSLCEALAAVRDGDRLDVSVSGIFMVGAEKQVLYDPQELTCRMDVQPATWVEFARDTPELDRLLEQSRRAYVTFEGELIGPEAVRPDDPVRDPGVQVYRRLNVHRRYGHLSGFRTQLTVRAVPSVRPVPESVPWEVNWRKPEAAASQLPVQPALPKYPNFARGYGVSGDVELDVTVRGGIPDVTVLSGDRLLAPSAEEAVRAWRFDPKLDAKFRTRFTYRLEQRLTGADPNPRIEMHLPWQVTITAPEYGW